MCQTKLIRCPYSSFLLEQVFPLAKFRYGFQHLMSDPREVHSSFKPVLSYPNLFGIETLA